MLGRAGPMRTGMRDASESLDQHDNTGANVVGLLVEHIPQGIYLVDRERRIQAWNAAAERLTGFKKEEVMGRWCGDGVLEHVNEEGQPMCGERCPLLLAAQLGVDCEADVFLHHKDGHRVPVHVRAGVIRDESGRVTGMAETFTDNTERLEGLERVRKLERMALLDALTGIGNRRYSEQMIQESIDNLHRNGTPFGLVMADIDHFKAMNDCHGHEAGDAVLKMVGSTMESNLRSFDFAGRWGGEEFIVVVHNAVRLETERVAKRLLKMVERSFLQRGDDRLKVTISAGVTQARPADTMESLYQRADNLLYRAKAAGRNRFVSDRGASGPAADGLHAA